MDDRKIALITGANKGIGRATAEQLSAVGMTVLIAARNPQHGEQAAAALRAAGGDAHAVTLDVTDPTTIQQAARWVEERFGHLDVLVNNAGITGARPADPMDVHEQIPSQADLDIVRSVFETNFFGVIMVTNACSRCCGARRRRASSTSAATARRWPSPATRRAGSRTCRRWPRTGHQRPR